MAFFVRVASSLSAVFARDDVPAESMPTNLPPDVDKTWLPLAMHIIFAPIALLVVVFRLIARWKGNGFKLDDYMIIAAMVHTIASSLCTLKKS